MIPVRVYLKGFMSYRDEQTLGFDGAPLWVVAGRNGHGKSAVFDAITFALYGRHRGGAQNARDLINHGADTLVIEFDFLLGGAMYRVRRTVPRRGQPTRQALRLIPADSKPHVQSIPDTDGEAGFDAWVKRTVGLSYKAFTSSVLLLQGQSEKLLQADPRDRYQILAEIIDLSPYQRLHEAVDERRKQYRLTRDSLDTQLRGIPAVTDAELAAAGQALTAAEEVFRTAQDSVDQLTELIGRAREWEMLTGDLKSRKEDLARVLNLLARADDIQRGLDRWTELDDVLPDIEDIVGQGERLAGYDRQTTELESQAQQLGRRLSEAEKEQEKADAEAERLSKEVEKLQQEATTLAKRLLQLAPLVTTLEQLESAEEELATLDEALAKLPADLDRKVGEAEERDRQLEAAGRAEPWLKELAAGRQALAEAQQKAEQARACQQAADAEIERKQTERDQLVPKVEETRQAENRLAHEVTSARTRYDEALGRRDRFAQTATQPKCSLCGQTITKEHAAEEQARLEAEVKSAGAELERVKQEHEGTTEHLRELSSNLADLDTRLTELAEESARAGVALSQAQTDARGALARTRRALGNLPDSYHACVALATPAEAVGWLATVYPTEDDLAEVRREAASRPAHQKRLRELKKQAVEWQRLDSQRNGAGDRLVDLKEKCPVEEAQQAREETGRLKQRQKELDAELKEGQGAHEEAKAAAATASKAAKDVRGQLECCNTQLTTARATRDEVERSRTTALEALPEPWRDPAANAGRAELAAWKAERDQLAHYEQEAEALRVASQSVDGLATQIDQLEARISALPLDARRPVAEVEGELQAARGARDGTDAARRAAEGDLGRLRERQERQCALEGERREADRQHHLHYLLANLLGPDGLQLTLLRRAEQGIVRLANGVLDGLSRGRMELKLREARSKEALDLLVYNRDTTTEPLAVALASGSQRFRIAVSLALAVGRYAGQEARRIESVIIDEGFGSLDKAGRDDMIQQLNDLKEQLARIILVSHQEEFTGAFVNGYKVELVDGTSRVSPLEQA